MAKLTAAVGHARHRREGLLHPGHAGGAVHPLDGQLDGVAARQPASRVSSEPRVHAGRLGAPSRPGRHPRARRPESTCAPGSAWPLQSIGMPRDAAPADPVAPRAPGRYCTLLRRLRVLSMACSLARALASIWRMRSRVTPNRLATSSRVRGCSPLRPKRSSMTLRSR